jgi:hypothetical protein
MTDRAFQLTYKGTIASGQVVPHNTTFTIPISTAGWSESNATFAFNMTVVYWSTNSSYCGSSKWHFACQVVGGSISILTPASGSAEEFSKIYGGTDRLTTVGTSVSGSDLLVTLTWATPDGPSPTRYYRCFIDAFCKDNT